MRRHAVSSNGRASVPACGQHLWEAVAADVGGAFLICDGCKPVIVRSHEHTQGATETRRPQQHRIALLYCTHGPLYVPQGTHRLTQVNTRVKSLFFTCFVHYANLRANILHRPGTTCALSQC